MITESEVLLRIDYSALYRFLNNFNDHLIKHDEQIAELQRLLSDVPSRNDINKIRDELDHKIDQFKDDLGQKIDDNNQILNDQIKSLKDENSLLSDRINKIESKLDQDSEKIANLESELDKLKEKISSLDSSDQELKISEAFEKIKNLNDMINENREYINTIATAYSLVNNGGVNNNTNGENNSILGPSLKRTLYSTSDYITRNFKKLQDALKALQNGNKETPTIVEKKIDIDLAGLNYNGSEISAKFEDEPQLPPIRKFHEIPEAVQYMYDSFPKLQGFLKALHGKLATVKSSDFDPSAFDNLLATIRKALADMASDINALKKQSGKGLTKADVMKLIRDFLDQEEYEDDHEATSIGYVKCIACGREINKVAGAMTEAQAYKSLGAPSNSIAFRPYIGDHLIRQSFGNSDEVDKSFYESPRSRRPKRSNRKYKPHPPD